MAGLMIRMKLAILSRSDGGFWGWKTWIGLALALGTINLGLVGNSGSESTAGVLALVMLAWLLGWVVAPIQTGGASTDALAPEQFSLLPIPPRRLAYALLAAAFVGKLPFVTAVAFLTLPVFALHGGPGPFLMSIPAVLLTVTLVLVLSKVVMGAAGSALRTRLGLEFVALQYALLISLSVVGWSTVPLLYQRGGFGDTGNLLSDGLPDSLRTGLLWLPSGWGVAAIHAAGKGDWLVSLAAFGALIALTGGLVLIWSRQLQDQMIDRRGDSTTRVAFIGRADGRHALFRTPLGAAMGREFRLWMREPRVALESRTVILTSLFIVGFPLIAGEPLLLPWIGVVTAIMATLGACNAYGLEGSALWLALSIPHGPARDVRAKQLVYLLLFGPVALTLTIIATSFSGETWAWPWAISATVAMIFGGTGIMILIALKGVAPVPEGARRSGDLMVSAENTGAAYLAMLSTPLTAIPAVAVVAIGYFIGSPAVQWLGVPVALLTGGAIAWWCGSVVIRGLETSGPELLDLLRHGVKPKMTATNENKATSTPTGWRGVVVTVCWWIFWIPLAQGVAPLAFKIADSDVTSWFLAPRLPDAWQWPTIITMLLLGVGLIILPLYLTHQYDQAGKVSQGVEPASGD